MTSSTHPQSTLRATLVVLLGLAGGCAEEPQDSQPDPILIDVSANAAADVGGRDLGTDVVDRDATSGLIEFTAEFSSGYEENEAVGCEGGAENLMCGEESLAHDFLLFFEPQPSADWRQWDLQNPEGVLPIYYEEDADPASRSARIVADPTQPDNRVLQFQLTDATIPTNYQDHSKGRVQTNTTIDPPTDEFFFRQRIYLHPDLNHLLDYPRDGDPWWLGVLFYEMRAGSPPLGDPHAFRMDLSLVPDFAAGEFRFSARGSKRADSEPGWTDVWKVIDADTVVPIGEWLTMEVAYRRGDADSGRFVASFWADGRPLVVLAVEGWTYSPDSPSPVSLNAWGGPQKIYTSDNVIHHIRDRGGKTQMYFDDFAVTSRWPQAWEPPPATATPD